MLVLSRICRAFFTSVLSVSIRRLDLAVLICVIPVVGAEAQTIRAPIDKDWTDACNVSPLLSEGYFDSGQAVCDAKSQILGGTPLIYYPDDRTPLKHDGVCAKDPVGFHFAKPFNGYSCPDGFDAQGHESGRSDCGVKRYKGEDMTCVRWSYRLDKDKNKGQCKGESCCAGNPINVAVGNKYQIETDLALQSLQFRRTYNSSWETININAIQIGSIGKQWTHDFNRNLTFSQTNMIATVTATRADGKVYFFNKNGTQWLAEGDVKDSLEELLDPQGVTTGWRYRTEKNVAEDYGIDGRLLSVNFISGVTQTLHYGVQGLLTAVEVNNGESLSLTYDTEDRISTLTDQAGRAWGYRYDAQGNLEYVDNPDGTSKRYHYENATLTHALTGITDERGIRYATFAYDGYARAILSTHAGNAQRVDIVYDDQHGTRTVTNSLGQSSTYTTTLLYGVGLVTGVSGPGCTTCGTGDSYYGYDANMSNLLTKTEQGLITEYGNHDSKGQPGYKIEAKGTPQERRTDYSYDSRFTNKITSITEPSVFSGSSKITTYTYDDFGNRLTETVNGFDPVGSAVSRTTTWQYNGPLNQLSQVNGPRTDVSDVTHYRYYANDAGQGSNRARLKEIEDATGVLTRSAIQYSATGKVVSEARPNGLTLTYSYYPGNDRLETLTESDGATARVTKWTYLATGEVETITTGFGSPSATTLTFGYDAARQLTRITDGLGNYIDYTLDTEGNRLAEKTYDNTGVLKKQLNQTFDLYNRVDITVQGDPLMPLETADPTFASDGTLDFQIDGEGSITDYSYDALKRLTRVTQDQFGSDPATANAETTYGYDAQDRLTSVIDPNSGSTTYVYDDLGRLLNQTSPDTGAIGFVYDAAGNLTQKTDAKGQVFTYSYDTLNRLTGIDVPGTADDATYIYGTCIGGSGRLCSVSLGGETTTYSYSAYGDVAQHQAVTYGYDAAGRLRSITYPSGAVVTYGYDAGGQVSQVDLAQVGQSTTLASAVQYAPFGGVTAITYGHGLALSQIYDLAYRLSSQAVPGVYSREYTQYDANGNLQVRNDLLLSDASEFDYDALNRLVLSGGAGMLQQSEGGTAPPPPAIPTEGLLAAYDFDADLLDQSGNGNHGSMIGTVNLISGVSGQAIDLTNGRIDFGAMDSFEGLNAYSLSAWVNMQSLSGWQFAIGKGLYWLDGEAALHCENSSCGIYIGAGTGRAEAPVVANTWQHWVGRYDNGQLSFFVDGALAAQVSATNTTSFSSTHFTAGAKSNGGNPSSLFLDELRLYNRALTDEEIGVLASVASGGVDSTSPGAGDLPGGATGYVYDLNGNRTQLNAPGAPVNATYQAASNRLGSLGTDSVTLDANGNTTALGSRSFVHNRYNRIVEARDGGTTLAIYGYNGLGQRVSKQAGGQTHAYTYGLDGQLLSESDGATTKDYVYLNGQLLAILDTGSVYYVHNDHLGTPQVLSSATGAVVWSAAYDPFGLATVNDDPDEDGNWVTLNARFPGQYYDQETGLHYNGARYYDPGIGRYITSDPIGIDGGLNTYLYANANPIRFFDPDGEAAQAAAGLCLVPGVGWVSCAAVAGGATVVTLACIITGACEDAAQSILGCFSSDADDDEENEECEQLLRVDTDTCNAITRTRGGAAGAACHASASQRYAACLRGQPLPPLNTWNN